MGARRLSLAGVSQRRPARYGNTFASLGDSILATGVGSFYQMTDGPLPHLHYVSRGRLYGIGYYAVSGQTSTQIAARIGSALEKRPRFLIILAGTNDHSPVMQGTQSAQSCLKTLTGNLDFMYRRALDKGVTPVACTITPYGDVSGTTTAQRTLRRWLINASNQWIRERARRYGIPLADLHAATARTGVDSSSQAGNWLNSDSTYTSDFVHPNAAGSTLLANALWSAISPLIPLTDPNWATDVLGATPGYEANNLLPNPLWVNSTGAPGVRPDNWTMSGTGVANSGNYTTTLGTDGTGVILGNILTLAQSGNAGSVGPTAGTSAINARAGDLVQFSGRFRKDANIGFLAQVYSTGQTNRYNVVNLGATSGAMTDAGWNLICPASTDGQLNLALFAGSGTGTVVLGQVSLVNLTQAGLADAEMQALVPNNT